jgi:MFS family permease
VDVELRWCTVQSAWKNRNLQLYFSGQFVSLIGTWMQQMALSWLVYRLTNSPMMLGVMGFTSQAPSFFFTPLAGILADRLNRHRIIIITQIFSLIQAAILATLVATGREQLWQLIILSVFMGIINAFDLTSRQSFLVDMLDDIDQLKSAMGVNSSINTLTRLVGPFLAGLFVAYAGEAMCFMANAASYLAVIVALLFIKTRPKTAKLASGDAIAQLKEAFTYTMQSQPIRDLILLLAFVGVVAMPFAVLMPAFAKDVFHGDATTLGLLTGASSAGSVVGAIFLAARKETRDLSRWIIFGTALSGLGLIIFGFSKTMLTSLPAVAVVGFGTMVLMAGANTVIQTLVDEDKRGRVMSFVIMTFMGTMPFGAVLAGGIANKIGVGQTVLATGVLTSVLALAFAKRIMQINNKAESTQVLEGILETEAELSEANV